jgi:hypothetical protein
MMPSASDVFALRPGAVIVVLSTADMARKSLLVPFTISALGPDSRLCR